MNIDKKLEFSGNIQNDFVIKNEWKTFMTKSDFPKENEEITVYWTDGSETDCVWKSEGMDWNAEIIPLLWKSVS